jgi:hypothetical protein
MSRTPWWMSLMATALLAAPLTAQAVGASVKPSATPAADTGTAVRPGMTEADVEARWGQPVAVRRMNDWTFLFYRNGDERTWGYLDTVFLQNGQVVDAIVRAPEHEYSGVSSDPVGKQAEFTPPGGSPQDPGPGAVTGVRVQPGR